jgi:hypothetical protein
MSAGSGKAVDPGHRGDLDKETFMAWGKLVFGQPWNQDIDPPPDLKEIARLLRLGKPIPSFVQDWLADLLDPPRDDGYDGVRLVLDLDGREAQKFKTKMKAFQKALTIQKVMDCGLTLSQAIDKVMPGQQRQGYTLWKSAEPFIEWIKAHPTEFERILKLYAGK